MAEELTPPKEGVDEKGGEAVGLGSSDRTGGGGFGGGSERKGVSVEEDREDILKGLAKACKRQGNFHLACKKYTQARIDRRGNFDFAAAVLVFVSCTIDLPAVFLKGLKSLHTGADLSTRQLCYCYCPDLISSSIVLSKNFQIIWYTSTLWATSKA